MSERLSGSNRNAFTWSLSVFWREGPPNPISRSPFRFCRSFFFYFERTGQVIGNKSETKGRKNRKKVTGQRLITPNGPTSTTARTWSRVTMWWSLGDTNWKVTCATRRHLNEGRPNPWGLAAAGARAPPPRPHSVGRVGVSLTVRPPIRHDIDRKVLSRLIGPATLFKLSCWWLFYGPLLFVVVVHLRFALCAILADWKVRVEEDAFFILSNLFKWTRNTNFTGSSFPNFGLVIDHWSTLFVLIMH